MKIAFDFDGVIIPDFEEIPKLGGLDSFYAMTQYIYPLFKPTGEYAILTGRRPAFRNYTQSYIDKHFDIKPMTMWHERDHNGGEEPWEYKTKVLNNHPEIRYYIESDPYTVKYITEHIATRCSAIHFADFIQTSFKK